MTPGYAWGGVGGQVEGGTCYTVMSGKEEGTSFMFLLCAYHCQAFSLTQRTLTSLQGLYEYSSSYTDEEMEA